MEAKLTGTALVDMAKIKFKDYSAWSIPKSPEPVGFTPQEIARLFERVQYRPHHFIDVTGLYPFSFGDAPVSSNSDELIVKLTAFVLCSVQRDGSYVGISSRKAVKRVEYSNWTRHQALKWLYEQVFLELETHDCGEWFKVDGEVPFNPHGQFTYASPAYRLGGTIDQWLADRADILRSKPGIIDDDPNAPVERSEVKPLLWANFYNTSFPPPKYSPLPVLYTDELRALDKYAKEFDAEWDNSPAKPPAPPKPNYRWKRKRKNEPWKK